LASNCYNCKTIHHKKVEMEINDFDKLGLKDVKKVYYNPDSTKPSSNTK